VTPADPLYAQQWHFALLGDIETIWNEVTGAGVSVYVADDGVQWTHPDLAANYDASRHFSFGGITYDPMPPTGNDGHGTSVAGLIAAAANGTGGVGVAHGAQVTGLDFLSGNPFLPLDAEFAAMGWARNFDIMSNSWGAFPAFDASLSLTNPASWDAIVAGIFATVSAEGRGGLGTIIVQAAGNDQWNAQGEGLQAARHTISVAATGPTGQVTSYSSFGANIVVAAPAAAVTTDLVGEGGYNRSGDADPLPLAYTSTFGGTSAATPVVSGVVALMLDANPALGWRDVHDILANSARLTGSTFGGPGTGHEIGAWQSLGTLGTWNGGGQTYHLSYGYGMVDAFAATRMAEVWHLFGPAETSANEVSHTVAHSGGPVRIPPGSGTRGTVNLPFAVGADIEIDSVYVTLALSHSYMGDLDIFLITPDGKAVQLFFSQHGAPGPGSLDWTFGVAGLKGYSSQGTWTLQIVDKATFDTGTLTAASLTFFGGAASADDTYHFTSDFLTVATVEPERRTLTDGDGGTDWLNLAAIAQNVSLNLAAGGQLRVGGTFWAEMAAGSDVFENAVTGDGNDSLLGNTLGNHLVGMRGDDTLSGLGGDDRLEGGAGNDSLLGGAARDTLYGGDGNDTLGGGSHNDELFGGAGNDLMDGNTANDRLRGEGGNDTLAGGTGNDTLWGGAQADRLSGGDGGDVLIGDGGNDRLFGGEGNDTLRGGLGNDILEGGPGNDLLSGAAGTDRFVFAPGSGRDTISDFEDNIDRLHLSPGLWGGGLTAAQVVAQFATATAGGVLFGFAGGETILVQGVADPGLLANDIVIV
jgi:Ca2+-binding RTX toxin-like protein